MTQAADPSTARPVAKIVLVIIKQGGIYPHKNKLHKSEY
jgi:hypothetical protein